MATHRAALGFLLAGVLLLAGAVLLPRFAPSPVPDFILGVLYGVAAGCVLGALIRWRMPAPCDTATPALRRRYLRAFIPAMALYVVALLVSVWLLKRVDHVAARALVALLPVPPVALAVRAMMHYIRDADELQRRIEVEALAIATACVSLGYLAAGFLQVAKVIDVPSGAAMIWVFPLVCLAYGLAKAVVSRRYA
jgi:hypothetical protein